MSEPQNGRGGALHRRASRHSFIGLLPRAAGLGRLGIQRGMDRQPDGSGTLSPDLHRRSAGRVVLCPAAHLSPGAKPAKPGTCARFPSAGYLQAHFLDRGRAGPWSRSDFLRHAIFLLITGVHHEKLFAASPSPSLPLFAPAATQTVTLSVPGMTCSACPITVKKAISKVEGVSKIDVTFETREAVVTFDDAKTSVQKLTKATGDAGYPSSVKQ